MSDTPLKDRMLAILSQVSADPNNLTEDQLRNFMHSVRELPQEFNADHPNYLWKNGFPIAK